MSKNTKKAVLPMRAKNKQGQSNRSASAALSSLRSTVKIARRENEIPASAARAVTLAARRARSSGLSVVEVSGNHLILVSPDGTHKIMKDIEPGVRVAVGKQTRMG